MSEVTNSPLVHLHVHSEYSLVDGAIRISDAIKKVKAQGHSALALTDQGNMYAAVEFYSKCKDADIKPIIGAEVYLAGSSKTKELVKNFDKETSKDLKSFHLVCLAMTDNGYKNLCRIVSAGYLEHSELEIPLVENPALVKNSKDIIAIASCLKSEFTYLLSLLAQNSENPLGELSNPSLENKEIVDALDDHVAFMKENFADRYYIELTDNNLKIQKSILPYLVHAAKHYDLPIVATGHSLYLNPEDQEAHAALTAVRNDLKMTDIRGRNKDAKFHLIDDEEMKQLFSKWPEALDNQKVIADQCNVTLQFGVYFLPEFELKNNEDINDALYRFSKEGLEERLVGLRKEYGDELNEETEKVYWDRLDYEVGVIVNMGFPGYFLIVQDFINWAKRNDIPVGPGRGSGAGSLVAYALKITDLDPLRFNLIFERFLNPERVSMPDFDVDFCQERREEVIQYVNDKYGAANVAQITTFGKMKAKAAIRDIGRVLELGYRKVDGIAKLIPNELDIKLTEALEKEPRIMEEARRDESVDKLIHLALKCEGLSRHTSVHAAGVVISEGGMENYVPVYKSETGQLITQYEMKNAEKVGLVKFDFLGLKTLTVIQKAVKIIQASKCPDFNIETIDLEQKEVYELVSSAQSIGIFQLESSGMQALLSKLKPSRFEDIIAVVALFRPGPLGSGMVDDFIERKHGRQEITYEVPQLEPILNDTYGIILYQEQVQKIAASLASYSLGEADLLRRAMGKKKPEEMAKQKVRFVSGCTKNGIDEKISDGIFELMAKFAAYGFNKSHSAAYGLVSYQTAYLKTFYPAEFMAAIMTCDLDNTEKIVRYIQEVKRMKFKIYPPNINRSHIEFDVPAEKSVGFGLAAIKGVGGKAIEPLVVEREENGLYTSLTDMAKRVNLKNVGKKVLELLCISGAFDCFHENRGAVYASIPEMVKFSEAHHKAKDQGQKLLFGFDDTEEDVVDVASWEEKLESGAIAKETWLDWLLKEQKILGIFLSGHPMEIYKKDISKLGKISVNEITQNAGQKGVPVVAFLSEISERLTKSGKRMAYIPLEDETGHYEAVMFEDEMPNEWPEPFSVVVAYLKINKSYDGTSINARVESIQPLEKVRKEVIKRMTIQLDVENENDVDRVNTKFTKLKKLFTQHPGKTSTHIVLKYSTGRVLIKPQENGLELNEDCYQELHEFKSQGIEFSYV